MAVGLLLLAQIWTKALIEERQLNIEIKNWMQ
jgi:hypothetical protein